MTTPPKPTASRSALLDLLDRRLDESDLHGIIFNLGYQFTKFGGGVLPKDDRLRNLYEYYEQRNDLATLFTAITHARPDIDLSPFASLLSPPAATTPPSSPAPAPNPASPTTPTSHYGTVFISFSSQDQTFAQQLHDDLEAQGVDCWFAPEDLPIGAKTRDTLHQQIGQRDKLLLILSQGAIASQWVEDEVEKALEIERRENRLVLFPIRLDDAVMTSTKGWAENLRTIRNIGNFTGWHDPSAYQHGLNRLLRDLKQ